MISGGYITSIPNLWKHSLLGKMGNVTHVLSAYFVFGRLSKLKTHFVYNPFIRSVGNKDYVQLRMNC
jgi:hypothetical protein